MTSRAPRYGSSSLPPRRCFLMLRGPTHTAWTPRAFQSGRGCCGALRRLRCSRQRSRSDSCQMILSSPTAPVTSISDSSTLTSSDQCRLPVGGGLVDRPSGVGAACREPAPPRDERVPRNAVVVAGPSQPSCWDARRRDRIDDARGRRAGRLVLGNV